MDPRVLNPILKFGRGILSEASQEWGDYLLITTPEVLSNAERMLQRKPVEIYFVKSMELSEIEKVEKELRPAEALVGIGGGMAIDFAKFVAWKRGMEPVLVPSAVSVDAPVCLSIAVREQGRVRYIGKALAKEILVDFELVQTAPLRLNRAGIGDILSIHTALFDWKLAEERGKAKYNQELARSAEELLKELEQMALEIRNASEKGLRWLMEAFARENAICVRNGNSRPEEGSEHFFAYNVERLTRRAYIHGELVCLGVFLLSILQENRVGWVQNILSETGVQYHPRELGLSEEEFSQALLSLPRYVEEEKLAYSVLNERSFTEEMVQRFWHELA